MSGRAFGPRNLMKIGQSYLALALSNRGRRGPKKDFRDAERLVKRLVAHELTLSFVPDVEQRLWRTVVRTKYQLTRNRVQLQNRLEALLEEAHIKLSSLVSDLLGASARRMLEAIAGGETNRETLAALADRGLRATQEQLQDALGVSQELNPVYRRLIKMVLDEVASIDKRIEQLNQEMAICSVRTRIRSSDWRRCLGWAWTRPAGHCRSGCHRSDLSFREASLLLGRRMPWG